MTITIPNAGEEAMLDLILATNYTLHLYRNDVTDGLSDLEIEALTVADFTEANFAGYSSKALTGGSWTTTCGPASARCRTGGWRSAGCTRRTRCGN